MIKDYFRLAYKGVKKRKLRSWLTMLGIFIGISAVVALISLSQGLQSAIAEQFVQLGSDKLMVQSAETDFGPPGTGVTNPLTEENKKTIEKVKGVDVAVGRIIRSVRVEFNDEAKYDYIATLPDKEGSEEMDLAIEANDYQIVSGRMLKKGDKNKVIVGHNYANNYFDKPVQIRDKLLVQSVSFEVVGILKKSGNPFKDNSLVVMETPLRDLLGVYKEYDLIAAKVVSDGDLDVVADRIKKELRKKRNVDEGKEDFTVETPGNILATLTTILSIVQGVLVGIAAISLLVGGIGIMNTMYTSVLERTKEIGIMKATGAKRSQILLLFLFESGILGLFGGLIGVSLGMLISKSVEYAAFQYYESYLIKASFDPVVLIGALLFAFFVGAISGVFPARQASKLKPVDALRK